MVKFRRNMVRFIRYLRRTYKMKIAALVVIGIGAMSAVLDGDGTALVFISMFAVPMFFMDKYFVDPYEEEES